MKAFVFGLAHLCILNSCQHDTTSEHSWELFVDGYTHRAMVPQLINICGIDLYVVYMFFTSCKLIYEFCPLTAITENHWPNLFVRFSILFSYFLFISRLSILYVCEKDSMANTSVNCKGRAFLNLYLVRNITELALVFIKDWIDFRGYPDQSRSMVKYKIHNHYNCDRLLLTYWSWENAYRLV